LELETFAFGLEALTLFILFECRTVVDAQPVAILQVLAFASFELARLVRVFGIFQHVSVLVARAINSAIAIARVIIEVLTVLECSHAAEALLLVLMVND